MNPDEHAAHNQQAEAKIRSDVREYGYHVALFEADGYLPAFAYSIGLYQTYQHPEIILFGLPLELMQTLIQQAGEAIKQGTVYQSATDYREFLEHYPVRFLSMERAHYPDYLGYATWFYEQSVDFPTIQLVWPDKEGLFPNEEGFNAALKFRQPLLDRNTDFKFLEERNLGVFTTQATLDGAPVLWVYHNEDGDWQFHSEEEPDIQAGKIVCLEELVKMDPSLNTIHYLNYGQSAVRSSLGADWQIFSSTE